MSDTISIYSTLAKKLLNDDTDTGNVLTLPDGSVDIYYEVREGRGRSADSRGDFAEWIMDAATSSCRLREIDRAPGGQSVNTARQSRALGDDVILFGHLDDPVFESLNMPTRSMGKPAEVNILVFEDGELMLSKVPRHYSTWDLENLHALPEYLTHLKESDVICIQNWVSFDNMNDVLRGLLDEDLGSTCVLFDPGDITESNRSEISRLVPAIQDVASEHGMVLSLNRKEMEYMLDMTDISASGLSQRLEKLSSKIGLEAGVIHHEDWALASTSTGTLRVPNIATEREKRTTGAGDRFNGGLAHALAADWDWKPALLLGNACASYHVYTGGTGTPETISTFISNHIDGNRSN